MHYRVYKQTNKLATSVVACFLLPHIVVVSLGGGSGSEIPTRVCLPNNREEEERRAGKKRPHFTYYMYFVVWFSSYSPLFYFAPLSFNFRKANALRLSSMREHPLHRTPLPLLTLLQLVLLLLLVDLLRPTPSVISASALAVA